MKNKKPEGLAVDKNKNVYICYSGIKEIDVWSEDFQESKVFLSSEDLGEKSPDAIAYFDKTDSLYVSYMDEDIIVCFKLP